MSDCHFCNGLALPRISLTAPAICSSPIASTQTRLGPFTFCSFLNCHARKRFTRLVPSGQSARGQPHSKDAGAFSPTPFRPRGFGVRLSSAAFHFCKPKQSNLITL